MKSDLCDLNHFWWVNFATHLRHGDEYHEKMLNPSVSVFLLLLTKPIHRGVVYVQVDVFHLGLTKNDLQGATLAIVLATRIVWKRSPR